MQRPRPRVACYVALLIYLGTFPLTATAIIGFGFNNAGGKYYCFRSAVICPLTLSQLALMALGTLSNSPQTAPSKPLLCTQHFREFPCL